MSGNIPIRTIVEEAIISNTSRFDSFILINNKDFIDKIEKHIICKVQLMYIRDMNTKLSVMNTHIHDIIDKIFIQYYKNANMRYDLQISERIRNHNFGQDGLDELYEETRYKEMCHFCREDIPISKYIDYEGSYRINRIH